MYLEALVGIVVLLHVTNGQRNFLLVDLKGLFGLVIRI